MSTFPGLPPNKPVGSPLAKYYRQPAIYFMPPSGGRWWPANALNVPPTGELAVYPMTSKDEILLRTPDALINGQGMIEVIQSCIPDIKDAWKTPSVDVDAILVAMRIASYGHMMDFEGKCNGCGEIHTYSLDLRGMLSSIQAPDFEQTFDYDMLRIKFKPQQYYGMNRTNKVNFEIQKLSQSIDNIADGDDTKATEAITQMNRIVDLSMDVLAECTEYIGILDNGQEVEQVREREYILEFYKNIDAASTTVIQNEYQRIASEGAIKPQQANCAGCGVDMLMDITFDYANFFVRGS